MKKNKISNWLWNKRAGYNTQMGIILRSSLVWDVTQQRSVFSDEDMGPTRCPETSVTTNLGSLICQKSDDLKDTAPEA